MLIKLNLKSRPESMTLLESTKNKITKDKNS